MHPPELYQILDLRPHSQPFYPHLSVNQLTNRSWTSGIGIRKDGMIRDKADQSTLTDAPSSDPAFARTPCTVVDQYLIVYAALELASLAAA